MKLHDPLDTAGLPESLFSEQLIFGAILKHSVDFWEVRSALTDTDFSIEKHRIIWRTLCEMHDAGRGIDRVTLAQSLHDNRELEACDGLTYLVSLDDGMPGLPVVDQYIRIVRDKSIMRRVIAISDKLRSDAILGNADSPSELLVRAEKMLMDLGMEASSTKTFSTPGEVIRKYGSLQSYLERGKDPSAGVPLGFPGLDALTCGMRKKQLWILSAITGGGKSTFARNIALNAGRHGIPGAFITLEMTEEEITDCFICAEGEIDLQVIRRGVMRDRAKLSAAAHRVDSMPIYIRDKSGCTLDQLHGELRKLKAEKDIQYAIVDYLQLISSGGRYESRNVEVGAISRGLKLIATDIDIPVMALSQIRRLDTAGADKNPKPKLHDLRDSGSIENDANVVIFLWSEFLNSEVPMTVVPTDVIVAKQRGGPIGKRPFGFEKSTGIFREFTQTKEVYEPE
jgi:replicative DNA helicase